MVIVRMYRKNRKYVIGECGEGVKFLMTISRSNTATSNFISSFPHYLHYTFFLFSPLPLSGFTRLEFDGFFLENFGGGRGAECFEV